MEENEEDVVVGGGGGADVTLNSNNPTLKGGALLREVRGGRCPAHEQKPSRYPTPRHRPNPSDR